MDYKKSYSGNDVLGLIKNKKSDYWMKKREEMSISLFKSAALRVPAYKDFLKKNKINPNNINLWQEFILLPQINKKNYLLNYSVSDLSWDGNLRKPLVFTATSGSTGEPVYFLRSRDLDWQYSLILENFINEITRNEEKTTLVIVCFGMGLWIGGLITYKAFEIMAQRRSYPLSIITPGINKKEIFNALKNIAPSFERVILAGYPPFIKDIVDEAFENGIDLKMFDVKLVFAAEAISEEYRDYIAFRLGIKNVYKDIINIYGSADIGAMAHETLASTLVKRLARKDQKIFREIFSPINKTPTLAQFNPLYINFEEVNGQLVLTGDSAMPLIRYAIGDHGGVFSFKEAEYKLGKFGINVREEAKTQNMSNSVNELPFVYVYERIDLSTSFYGLCIYPEWIRPALLETPICEYLTGKFTLITKYDKSKNQYLEINLELKKNKKHSVVLEKLTTQRILKVLQANSSEFREIYLHLKKRAIPKLIFWSAENPTYFSPGVKQKWVRKEALLT